MVLSLFQITAHFLNLSKSCLCCVHIASWHDQLFSVFFNSEPISKAFQRLPMLCGCYKQVWLIVLSLVQITAHFLILLVDSSTRRPGDFLLVGYHTFFNPPGDQEILLVSWWLWEYSTPPGENLLVSWWINPPGDQENRLVSWWIKKKGGTPPGDLENLLVSWWINSPGDQEIFSWWGTTYFLK